MKLCIADPPYLGRAAIWYGDAMSSSQRGKRHGGTAKIGGPKPADHHPDAHLWDDPETHRALVELLCRDYDGWAIAMSRDSLPVYLSAAPTARVCVWHNPAAWPPGGRVNATWEPVVLNIPEGRRALGSGVAVRDHLSHVPPRSDGFIGAKPPAWTRWVLDMLGYDAETDTVDDLFHGSGAVAAELAQGVLL